MGMRVMRFVNRYSVPCMWAAGVCTLGAFAVPSGKEILFALAALLAGFPVVWRAVQGLRFKTVGIELLVTIAVVGAFCIGELSEAAIVTFLFQFGSWLEQKTMKKTRSAIKELTALIPAAAWRVEGDEITEIDADEVEEGDTLLARTGCQIAADGVVIRGEGFVNEASITGESQPKAKSPGDPVYAGTLLDSGTLYLKAARVGEDTTFAKIIALVEEAQDAKSPAERFIDKFARYYTPAVVVMAALVFLLLRDADTAITVLVLACPGALVIGAPIANVAGIGAGARKGILLKGGDSVHTFAKTDTVVFDKTGTLTLGRPAVTGEHRYCADADAVLALAASAERAAEHPLARAIVRYAEDRGLTVRTVSSAEPVKGLGIRADVEGRTVLAGSTRLMQEWNVKLPDSVQQDIRAEQQRGAATVLIAVDGELKLLLGISDAVRPDAAACVRSLHKQGIRRTVLLTGDNPVAADAAAKQTGIREVHAELLPQEKMTLLRQMQEAGAVITFVGDGINDSPALTAADTGIAVGSGADAAIDCSDVVLIRPDLMALPEALRLSKQTAGILNQNIAIAVGTVVFLLVGLFAGFIHMAVGMLVHEASILAVILNAMRLLLYSRKNKEEPT